MSLKRQLPVVPRLSDPALFRFLSAMAEVIEALPKGGVSGTQTVVVPSSGTGLTAEQVGLQIEAATARMLIMDYQLLSEELQERVRANIGAAGQDVSRIANNAVQPESLSTVATSNSYNDLDDKPIIPTMPAILQGTAAVSLSAATTGSTATTAPGMTAGASVLVSLAPAASGHLDPATLIGPAVWASADADQVTVHFHQDTALTGSVRIHWLAVL